MLALCLVDDAGLPRTPPVEAPKVLARVDPNDMGAQWLGALRELGEVVDNRALYFESASAEPRRWVLPHEAFDGLRMMQFVLREIGKEQEVAFPAPRVRRPPPWLSRMAALWRQIRPPKREPVKWRSFDRGANGSADAPLGWALLDRDETAALNKLAKKQHTTPTALLFWALDRAVFRVLAEPKAEHSWSMSVSLRGAVGELNDLPNVAVGISITFPENASAVDVKDAMHACLKANDHWGAWHALRLLGFLGPRRMRSYIAKYQARPGHSSIGTFSYMSLPKVEGLGWMAGPPLVFRTHPVSGGAVEVGGRLSLSIQTHPGLGDVDVKTLANRWRDYALGKLQD
jgi:hypothetical protein